MGKCPTRRFTSAGLVILLALTAACASSNVLNVKYQLPPASGITPTHMVTIAVADERTAEAFLTPSAKNELAEFTGVYALTVAPAGGGGELKGAYTLDSLFREVLRHRMENAGVKVLTPGAAADAEVRLVLSEFQLDFGDRKWSTVVAYRAQLMKDGVMLSQQTVNGSAERIFLAGKRDADRVVGELLSDAINKLDIALLFKQAGL
ncbi:MAG: hypothetical protein R6V84_15490 [Desulfobacterales bacterium]